jgi:hypothetical protein
MNESPIETYLNELSRRLRGAGRIKRRMLEEVSDHLHAAAADLHVGDLSQHDAEAEAVGRFGPVRDIATTRPRRSPAARVALILIAVIVAGGLFDAAVQRQLGAAAPSVCAQALPIQILDIPAKPGPPAVPAPLVARQPSDRSPHGQVCQP